MWSVYQKVIGSLGIGPGKGGYYLVPGWVGWYEIYGNISGVCYQKPIICDIWRHQEATCLRQYFWPSFCWFLLLSSIFLSSHSYHINYYTQYIAVRPHSHRSIRYTVFAIRYTFCSPPQTRFRYFHATSLECRLWRRANRIAYSEYRIAYTSMWTRPNGNAM